MKNPAVEEKLINFIREYSDSSSLYWFPLVQLKKSLPVAAYDILKIYENHDIPLLEKVFDYCGISNVCTFQMDHLEYFEDDDIVSLLWEKDGDDLIFPWYVETFYFDPTESWLVYLSHEHTISFAGEKIVKAALELLPDKYTFPGWLPLSYPIK